MKKSNQIASRFREVMINGKWIANTNYKDLLANVSREQATKKIGNLNTIAALTFHVNYYIAGILEVFEGGNLNIRDKYSFDLPEIHSEKDWDQLRNALQSNAEKFAWHVDQMTDRQLDTAFTDEKYGTWRRNIEGMIEHAYYHLGQISLIKKLIIE